MDTCPECDECFCGRPRYLHVNLKLGFWSHSLSKREVFLVELVRLLSEADDGARVIFWTSRRKGEKYFPHDGADTVNTFFSGI